MSFNTLYYDRVSTGRLNTSHSPGVIERRNTRGAYNDQSIAISQITFSDYYRDRLNKKSRPFYNGQLLLRLKLLRYFAGVALAACISLIAASTADRL